MGSAHGTHHFKRPLTHFLMPHSINKDFDGVAKGCQAQHENCWLYPPLLAAYKAANELDDPAIAHAKYLSWEIYHEGNLVAGELGYIVGRVYTSLSGFCSMDSAGTVQLCVTGSVLERHGFAFWDLGMHMDYKEHLGAKAIPRKTFLQKLKAARTDTLPPLVLEPTPARDLLRSIPKTPSKAESAQPETKRQRKKEARQQAKREAKALQKTSHGEVGGAPGPVALEK